MSSIEKYPQSTSDDKDKEKKGAEFREGFLHVHPEEKGEKITGVVEETPDGLVYVKRDGGRVIVKKEKAPAGFKPPEGYIYIKTESTPEKLRGFVAVAQAYREEKYVEQSNINKARENMGLSKEFIIGEGLNEKIGEVEGEIVEGLAELEEGMNEEKKFDKKLEVLEEMSKGRELDEDKEKTFVIWKKRLAKIAVGIALLAATANILTSSTREAFAKEDANEPAKMEQTVDSGGDGGDGGDGEGGPEPSPKPEPVGEGTFAPFDLDDAKVRPGEGITQVFQRQLDNNPELADDFGYDGSPESLAKIAQEFGYMSETGDEVRVSEPGVAYKLIPGGKVQEFSKDGKFVESHNLGSDFESPDQQDPYEYLHQKN